MAAGHGCHHQFVGVGVVVGNRAGLGVMGDDGHLQHDARARRDRQERRIARGAFLAQRRQHDGHHLVEVRQEAKQGLIEFARRVAIGRRHEFVFKTESVEKGAQPRVVVLAERRMRAERVRHFSQRLAEVLRQQVLVRHVVGHLAQPVHVIGERNQPRLDLVVGQDAERVAHHGRARDFAERADERQA